MKYIKYIVLLLFIVSMFFQVKGQYKRSTDETVFNIRQFIDNLLSETIALAESTSDSAKFSIVENVLKERFPDRNVTFDEWRTEFYETDSLRNDLLVVRIGKLVDCNNIFAAAYSESDSLFCFFRLNGKEWKEVGRHQLSSYVTFFETEELNGKPGREILASTSYNMNGNKWSRIFSYFKDEDEVRFVGNICTYYKFNQADTTVFEEYAGSWYMDIHKTIYIWHKDMLVPFRHAVIVVPKNIEPPFEWALEYYENPELKYDAQLQLIFKEKYGYDEYENDKHTENYKRYWENFFELGKNPLGNYQQK